MNSHDRYPDPDPHPSQYDDDFEDDEENWDIGNNPVAGYSAGGFYKYVA